MTYKQGDQSPHSYIEIRETPTLAADVHKPGMDHKKTGS